MYTGGLENRPSLLRRLAGKRLLWGNGAEAIATVRSPMIVANLLSAHGIPCPALLFDPALVPLGGRWLVKPFRSAGGRGIRFFSPDNPSVNEHKDFYFQEYIEGSPCSALYVGDGRSAHLLGVTRQLVGEDWLHAAPFHYCGSIGPIVLSETSQESFRRLGNTLAMGCSLRGLFGVDCVLSGEVPRPVEINPRYTASTEVLEYATGMTTIALHRQVFECSLCESRVRPANAPHYVGKAILFARKTFRFPDTGPWLSALQAVSCLRDLPAFADIPLAGEDIEAGSPILTFFSRADSPANCARALRQIAADLDRCLFGQ